MRRIFSCLSALALGLAATGASDAAPSRGPAGLRAGGAAAASGFVARPGSAARHRLTDRARLTVRPGFAQASRFGEGRGRRGGASDFGYGGYGNGFGGGTYGYGTTGYPLTTNPGFGIDVVESASERPAVPSAIGIRDTPVQGPAIYVIGKPGRQSARNSPARAGTHSADANAGAIRVAGR